MYYTWIAQRLVDFISNDNSGFVVANTKQLCSTKQKHFAALN